MWSRGDRCLPTVLNMSTCVFTRLCSVHTHVSHAVRVLWDGDRRACILKRLCLFVSTYISAGCEHSLGASEAEQAHFQPTVLPRCLSAERWFSSSSIMARCKKSKKAAPRSGHQHSITMAWRGGRKWHCCDYSDHKSVRLEPTYISSEYSWSLKATRRGDKRKKL